MYIVYQIHIRMKLNLIVAVRYEIPNTHIVLDILAILYKKREEEEEAKTQNKTTTNHGKVFT